MEKENLILPAENLINAVTGFIEWDENDADYVQKIINMSEDEFFGDDALLYALAFVTTPETFLNDNNNSYTNPRFGHHVLKTNYVFYSYKYDEEEEDLNTTTTPIATYLRERGFLAYTDVDFPPHSVHKVNLQFIDEERKTYNIDFSYIREKEGWGMLPYEEILRSVNEKCLKAMNML